MKFLFIMTVAVLLPFKFATAAWSNPAQTNPVFNETEQSTLEPIQSESIEPLLIEQNRELVSDTERVNQLTNQAERINYTLDAGQTRSPRLRDLLNLPDGMVIRGSSRGGIGIGTEY